MTDPDSWSAQLRAGIAIFNEGHYHAAHDAWEPTWLYLEQGTRDERFLHGLIQLTAAVFHALEDNHEGASGLAESALEYLDGHGPSYRGVALDSIRTDLQALHSDPDQLTAGTVPELLHLGVRIGFDDLDDAEIGLAARVFAAETASIEEHLIDEAIKFAEAEDARFRSLLREFVRNETQRHLIYERLAAHVDHETHRRQDVEHLFDEKN